MNCGKSIRFLGVLLLFFISNIHISNAQSPVTNETDTIPFIRTGNIKTKFAKSTLILKKGEIISNVMTVINVGNRPTRFLVDVLAPGGWTRIDDASKVYTLQANDTIYVPILISPTKLVGGNTEILINTFLVNDANEQIGNNYFTITTKKNIAWELDLDNTQNIYFKNDELTRRFNFELFNKGNYRQDFFINYTIPNKNLVLSDTLDRVLKEYSSTFTLEPGERRSFDYNVTLINFFERNLRRIPLNSYIPNVVSERRNYSLIINSSEPKITRSNTKKRTKVNFIKLPNEIDVEKYGYPNLPLIVELVAQNVLNDQSFMSLNLNGFKQITPYSSLIYSTQLNYSNSFFTNDVFANAPWYVGYFDEKMTIEAGQIAGNLIGLANAGKGVKGSYRINERHQVGGFYTNSAGLFDGDGNITYGLWHRFKYNNDINLESKLGRNHNTFLDRVINIVSVQPSIRFNRDHYVSVLGSYTNKDVDTNLANMSPGGFLISVNQNSSFLDKKLKINNNIRFNDKNFSFGNFGRFIMNNRANYTFNDKWSGFFTSNYQNIETFSGTSGNSFFKQEFLFTNLVFSTTTKNGSYQPGIFYEYRNLPINRVTSRGLTFRYSNFDFFSNFISSVFLRAGYTRPLDDTILDPDKEYFNLELSTLIRYRTWNLTARYNYGAFSSIATQSASSDFVTPQSLRISLQNQYLFPNNRFAVESNGIYSYNNIFRNHTLGLFPGIFYFTDSGWRFGINVNYTFSSSNFSSVFDAGDIQANPTLGNLGSTTSSNLNLAFNLRKEFAIPIPFMQKEAVNARFVSFLDIDGDGKKDNNETALNNVVVKLNRNEVLTNVDGIGVMNNVKIKKYKLETFSLEKLNGWFPNVKDSIVVLDDGDINIPFVRGIKVYGDVIVDRQKIAVTTDEPLDLSRIKISASNQDKVYNTLTNSEGRFEFYLPFGDYIMTMDQGVLGDRFQITRNNIPIRLRNNQDGVYVSFYVVEKRRRVIFKDFTPKKN